MAPIGTGPASIAAATASEGTPTSPTRTNGAERLTGPSASYTVKLWPTAAAASVSSS